MRTEFLYQSHYQLRSFHGDEVAAVFEVNFGAFAEGPGKTGPGWRRSKVVRGIFRWALGSNHCDRYVNFTHAVIDTAIRA